ncbi:arsenical-resistance protein [Tistrella bauzanensis]|uniref:Arsenical-resistance protein n=1 Tax=Tistrella bauzanensis TaxID=657419 RepID=A0ABQ1IN67_9PROT|nr:ACR3 family arsenite efflux transporter [Tistrella bauzanensis]GGB46343.1 arsenical-resistance protein [Tistrella bauzanensis]
MTDHTPAMSPISRFERHLTLWVALAIAAGIALGAAFPQATGALAGAEIARINLPVAVLVWAMIFPMMLGIAPRAVLDAGRRPAGLVLTLVVNWLIKPFTMAALGILFFEHVFADLVDPQDARAYIAGMILLGVAPCTAMVFVWSRLVDGDGAFTLAQVGINDLVMILAFAPLAALLLGVAEVFVPWDTLLLSVLLFVVIPFAAAMLVRARMLRSGGGGQRALDDLSHRLKPWGAGALILTVALLFAFQGQRVLDRPLGVVLVAVPLLVQSYGIFALAYLAARVMKLPFSVAAPAALIGTSNFFELAVAVAIGLFGIDSGAVLATVVGVLVEVPVMLSLVAFARRTRHWFPAATA